MIIVGFSGARNSKHYTDTYNISFVGHDSSIAILVDGKLKYASEEERFSREKHTAESPFRSLQNGLNYCGLKLEDIDYFAFPWALSSVEILKTGANHLLHIPATHWASMGRIGLGVIRDAMSAKNNLKELENKLNGSIKGRVTPVEHHMAHITNSFAFSNYQDAAVLSIDGSGGYLSSLSGIWENDVFRKVQSIKSPHSLGILYGLTTEFLGFRSGYDEYKVMGMAAYGNPTKYIAKFKELIWNSGNGFKTKYTGLILNLPFVMRSFEKIFGISMRSPSFNITQVHFDIAAALQQAIEEQIFRMLQLLRKNSLSDNLCLSGGVFQNSVANGKILSSGIFKNIFISPVPGDNGTSLGAAMFVHQKISKSKVARNNINLAYWGPDYSEKDCLEVLNHFINEITFEKVDHVVVHAAKLLSDNNIIGWFQGRMEYGSRALGNRSILASPAKKEMMEKLNLSIKNRESFRPFGASITCEKSGDYFEINQESPYMQFVVPIQNSKINSLQAINHFKTCRIQTVNKKHNPLFHSLLVEFEKLSGDPVLLNTSFNGKDEPIVCNPFQALNTFLSLQLDALFIGNYIVKRKKKR